MKQVFHRGITNFYEISERCYGIVQKLHIKESRMIESVKTTQKGVYFLSLIYCKPQSYNERIGDITIKIFFFFLEIHMEEFGNQLV